MRKLTPAAPKKKAQKMALADFFAETGGTSRTATSVETLTWSSRR